MVTERIVIGGFISARFGGEIPITSPTLPTKVEL
jgi:hypothetical protein